MLYIILIGISHLMIFANDITCYLYLFYTIEMMLDKKKMWTTLFIQILNGFYIA